MKILNKVSVKTTGHDSVLGFFKSWISHVTETPVTAFSKKEFLEWLSCYPNMEQVYDAVAKLPDDTVFWPTGAEASSEPLDQALTLTMTYNFELDYS